MSDVPAELSHSSLYLEGEKRLSPPAILGGTAIVFAACILAIWSSLAPIASAVIETGTVVAQGGRKLLQHPDGGIINKILVSEGDQVVAGQLIIKLDDTRQRSTQAALRSLLLRSRVQQSRLEAERDGSVSFSVAGIEDQGDATEVRSLVLEQTRLLELRAATMRAKLNSLLIDEQEAESTIRGERYQFVADAERLQLTTEELRNAEILAKSGDGTRQRVLEVRRAAADLKGAVGATASRISETQQRLEHARSEKRHMLADFAESLETEVVAATKDRVELSDKMANVTEQILRSEIRAPVSGRIVGLNVHTIGGLALAGSVLAEIVPADDQLIIESQVSPTDAESITAGMAVDLRVGGVRSKTFPRITGSVLSVSADRLLDHARGIPFFVVQVGIDASRGSTFPSGTLKPGMSVDVLILKGARTPLQYMIQPFMNFFRHSLRD